ncbi:DUF3440 domain-containing protein [Nocardia sp. CNY236]|uniref:DUF3440 domain-containing protein n=1 Tax=Nocardia sp. CNY236 TaxID=1169152 RepID=UPI0004097C7D|nr:DUF3440 domain-containing protein [Nocardia sp. CNY236]
MKSVWDATQERLATIFGEFDHLVVAFSGGKDSAVMLHAAIDYARVHHPGRRLTVLHIDYEAQYSATTDYVTQVMTSNLDVIDPVWICLPIAAGCSVTMTTDHWLPWAEEDRDLWVRDLPDYPGVIHEGTIPAGFPPYRGVRDYTFQSRVTRWLHQRARAERTAVLVGIREQESLHRWAAINRTDKLDDSMYQGLRWTSRIYTDIWNAYPIHDWLTEDVWVANARFDWSYNRLYDLMHLAGVPLHAMRVSSPFHQQAIESLRMFRVIEPELWVKLVGRVNGVNFTAIYAGTSAMGAGKVTLPPGHTWKSYRDFLLTTLPEDIRARYEAKFATSERYWTRGGALPVQHVQELRDAGTPGVEYLGPPTDARKRSQPAEMVKFAEPPDDLPISATALAPTRKRQVITILRNDVSCKTMGFGPTKLETERRKAAIAKYKEIL